MRSVHVSFTYYYYQNCKDPVEAEVEAEEEKYVLVTF